MKTGIMSLALVLLVGFLGAGCATVSRFDTEYERTQAPYSIDWSYIDRDADSD